MTYVLKVSETLVVNSIKRTCREESFFALAMTSLTQTFAVSPGINYEYVYRPPTGNETTTFLFLHGFPSSLHAWRHQIDYFSRLGYGCLAPNLLGYGKTYSPSDIQEYRTKQMVLHLVTLLSHLMINRPVIVVGHDFGTVPASRFALYEPERVQALILLSIGYRPPGLFDIDRTIDGARQALGYDVFGYWKFFGSDSDAADLIEKNVNSFLDLAFPPVDDALTLWRSNFSPIGKLKEWLQEGRRLPRRASYLSDTDYYVHLGYILEGMKPKLNWYKAQLNNINEEDERHLNPNLQMPCLFIAGLRDAIAVPALFASQKQYMAQLTVVEMNATHWIMEEKPREVNDAIEKWIMMLH
jgi:soluble epoxide hydrolase/lipid-phosphate phosphatase